MPPYSSILLVANSGVTGLTDDLAEILLMECGLARDEFDHEVEGLLDDENDEELLEDEGVDFGIHDSIYAIFDDASAHNDNYRFFCPDGIGFSRELELSSPHFGDVYEDEGWCFKFGGPGYFYPWTDHDLQTRFTRNEKLMKFRETVQQRFGGEFIQPQGYDAMFEDIWLDGTDGWLWFGCQTW